MKKILLSATAIFLLLSSSCEVEVRDGHHYQHPMGYEHAHYPDHHEVYDHGYHHDSHGGEIDVHVR